MRNKFSEDDILASGFSILADETTDISGHEQLSLAVRYYAEDVQNIPASSPRYGGTQRSTQFRNRNAIFRNRNARPKLKPLFL